MKVRVTYELDDTKRLAVGAIVTGELVPATREQIEAYAQQLVDGKLDAIASKLTAAQQTVLDELTKGV